MIDISFSMTIEHLNQKTDEMHTLISSNVVKYRKLKNFSQLKLAVEIGLTGNAFISRAEKRIDNAHFNIEHIVKIAIVLDVDMKLFFEK